MEITTIKLRKGTKIALDRLKEEKESYDAVIARLTDKAGAKDLKKALAEGYKSLSKEELGILKDWETATGEIVE